MNTWFRSTSGWLASMGRSAALRLRSLWLFGLIAVSVSVPALAASVAYTYDALGRLTKATYSTGVVITYAYDVAGNRTSQVTTGVP